MREYTLILMNMVNYASIYLKKKKKKKKSAEYARILNVLRQHITVTVQIVEPLSRRMYPENC